MTALKGIHFGSYWMGTNDVVYLMARDLEDLCELRSIDPGIYSRNPEQWFEEDSSRSPRWPVRWLNETKVLTLVDHERPDFIIVNSGGMSLRPSTVKILREKKIVMVGISLSDPDVYPENGAIYSELYDLFYTNARYALMHLYSKKTNIKLLPFAASARLHRPIKSIEKKYDVVVVGHARPQRVKTVNRLKKHFNVGLFGDGWGGGAQCVQGQQHVEAINSGKMCLSFSATAAGYTNVKVGLFEAVACGVCVVTQSFNELELYFKYGVDVVGYAHDDMLLEAIETYNKKEKLRCWIAENGYKRLLEQHTWSRRWAGVLDDIRKCQLG